SPCPRPRTRRPGRARRAPRAAARSRAPHPAHRPEVAPLRALAALRVVPDVARADPLREAAGELPRRLHARPELVLGEVVLLRQPRDPLLVGAQEPAL